LTAYTSCCIVKSYKVLIYIKKGEAMCQTAVYLIKGGKEETLSEDIAHIRPVGDKLELVSLTGEKNVIDARIKEINLLKHKITLTSET
jgi:predicted RNA-binding protein